MMCSECQQVMMERRFKPAETMLINRVHQAHLIGATPAQVERWLHRQGVVWGHTSPRPGEKGPFVQDGGREWVLFAETPPGLTASVGLTVWTSRVAFQFNKQHRLTSVRVRRSWYSF
jgi:hypothetical protein